MLANKRRLGHDQYDVPNDYQDLYEKLCALDRATGGHAHFRMTFYSLCLIADSFNREAQYAAATGQDLPERVRTLVRLAEQSIQVYYRPNLYDTSARLVNESELGDMLSEQFAFVLCPMKPTVPTVTSVGCDTRLIGSYDASPCFEFSGSRSHPGGRLRLAMDDMRSQPVGNVRIRESAKHIMGELHLRSPLTQPPYYEVIEKLVGTLLWHAACYGQMIAKWADVVLSHPMLVACVTDQTLAPGCHFICAAARQRHLRLVVAQHQRNYVLSNIYPLILSDLLTASEYHCWYDQETFESTYGGAWADVQFVDVPSYLREPSATPLGGLESARTCLLIVNTPSALYINGTSVNPEAHVSEIAEAIALLQAFDLQVHIRDDPRNVADATGAYLTATKGIARDCSDSVAAACADYDLVIVDRPGNAAVEALDARGFVLVAASNYSRYLTPHYHDLRVDPSSLANLPRLFTLARSFDLLVAKRP